MLCIIISVDDVNSIPLTTILASMGPSFGAKHVGDAESMQKSSSVVALRTAHGASPTSIALFVM